MYEPVPGSEKSDRNKRERAAKWVAGNKVKFQDIGIHGKIAKRCTAAYGGRRNL